MALPTRPGLCGFTHDTEGDCELGRSGGWRVGQHGIVDLQTCTQQCLRCAACRYVSFSAAPFHRDCSWYRECNMDALMPAPATGRDYVSLRVRRRQGKRRKRARPRELHVLTFSTPETCELLHCWFSWMAAMTRSDTRTRYHLHVEAPGQIASGRHVVRGHRPVWFEALRMRLGFVVRFMNSTAVDEGALVLFTDLDVLPFRPLSELAVAMPQSSDVHFMREPCWQCSPVRSHADYRGAVNAGVYLMRGHARTRRFLEEWRQRLEWTAFDANDQDVAFDVLRANKGRTHRWGTFPPWLVAGLATDVTNETVAYHAIGATTRKGKERRRGDTESKVLKFEAAAHRWRTSHGAATLPTLHRPAPRCDLSAAAKACAATPAS
jgi:hypothetical protein